MKSRLREEFFEQKNIMLIEAQLNRTDAKSPPPQAPVPWIPPMPERAELASLVSSVDMRSADWLDSRVAAVQAMADLCGRVEKRSRNKRAAIKSKASSPEVMAEVVEADPFPMRFQEIYCLFCIGDRKQHLEDRARPYSRLQKLWAHAKVHLEKLPASDIPCPHPLYKIQGITLANVEHLLNHAHGEHNIRLQCR